MLERHMSTSLSTSLRLRVASPHLASFILARYDLTFMGRYLFWRSSSAFALLRRMVVARIGNTIQGFYEHAESVKPASLFRKQHLRGRCPSPPNRPMPCHAIPAWVWPAWTGPTHACHAMPNVWNIFICHFWQLHIHHHATAPSYSSPFIFFVCV